MESLFDVKVGPGQKIERRNIKYRLGLYVEKNITAESWHRKIQLDNRKHLKGLGEFYLSNKFFFSIFCHTAVQVKQDTLKDN
ncbi:hypothetical protein BpHYR1_004805 [Brachionus plicatilis]|uniref:Uncharacterized protein n=1 Tax=Brachionus plicatilis TaxID=10195 RepID=A0A3M7PWH3_BRAPC|nr:hypothetical protein BpHYR1_004805 [Brachionus plicatilis]